MSTKILKTTLAIIAVATSFCAINAHADAKQTLLEAEGYGILVVSREDNGLSHDSRVYSLIVGSLQRSLKKANKHVYNMNLPREEQPDWSKGQSAVDALVASIDNQYLDTVILVEAEARPDMVGRDMQTRLKLNLKFYDVDLQTVFRQINTELEVPLTFNCDSACVSKSINRGFIKLGKSVTEQTIASIQEPAAGLIAGN